MKSVAGILIVLLFAPEVARAADSCAKECRAYYQICVKNHSQAACKMETDICLKHCKK